MNYGKIEKGIIKRLDLSEDKMEVAIPRPATREVTITEENADLYLDQIDEARELYLAETGEELGTDWLPETIIEEYTEYDRYVVFFPNHDQILSYGWYPLEDIDDDGETGIVDGVLKVYHGKPQVLPVDTDSQEYKNYIEDNIRQRYTLSDELSILRQRDSDTAKFNEYFRFCENCKAEARQHFGIDIVLGEDD